MKKIISIYKKYEEVINYLIVGFLTVVISLASKWGLLFTVLDAKNSFQLQLSIIISWIVAVTFAYVANRIFVFKSKNKNIIKEILSFVFSRILTLIIEMIIMWFFVTLLKFNTDLNVVIFTIISQIIVIVLNYIFSKLLVFKK